MMLFPDGPKARIKLFHHGEIMVGINERLGDPEMNTVLTLTQEQHDEKERRDKDKEQQKDAKRAKRQRKIRKVSNFNIIGREGSVDCADKITK